VRVINVAKDMKMKTEGEKIGEISTYTCVANGILQRTIYVKLGMDFLEEHSYCGDVCGEELYILWGHEEEEDYKIRTYIIREEKSTEIEKRTKEYIEKVIADIEKAIQKRRELEERLQKIEDKHYEIYI